MFAPNFKLNEIREEQRTLDESTRIIYSRMDKCFNSDIFVRKVQELTRKQLKEQTIINSLRKLRKNGLVNYIVLDSYRREYRKSSINSKK